MNLTDYPRALRTTRSTAKPTILVILGTSLGDAHNYYLNHENHINTLGYRAGKNLYFLDINHPNPADELESLAHKYLIHYGYTTVAYATATLSNRMNDALYAHVYAPARKHQFAPLVALPR